MLSAPYILVN